MIRIKNLDNSCTEFGMDSKHQREGLHIWIGNWETHKIKGKLESILVSHSIHLNRNQCRKLRDEINKRLF